MFEQSQTCPSCRSSKYSNPQLKLMVNVCGHSLCENCVEVLFVRGSGLCAQCKTPIRKTNFRYQLFEDPLVQKEVDIRKKVLSDFNKREDDFDCPEDYESYLEKVEEIIYNLTNDLYVEDTKRYIENYKKENKDIIKRNRTRPSASQTFYECELERESILREKREREEEEEEGQPEALKPTSASDDPTTSMVTESEGEKRKSLVPPTPRTNMLIPPASSFGRRPPTTFVPPSISAPPSYIVPPTQGVGYAPSSAFPARSLVTPVSGLMAPPSMFPVAPPTGSSSNDWLSRPRHAVRLPHMQSVRKQQDTVLIPSQHTSQNTKQEANEANRFVYEPYQVELCGPTPPLPSNQHTRWNDILEMYENTIIANLPRQTRSPLYSPDIKPNFEAEHDYKVDDYNIEASDIKPTCNPETGFLKTEYDSENDHHVEGMISKTEDPAKETKRLGLSHKLNVGACGIAPAVFIERCLMESRCGLFI